MASENYIGPGFYEGPELTLDVNGEITVTGRQAFRLHTIGTYAYAATDNLVTITGGNEGETLFLFAANTARTTVVKHGTGNIRLVSGMDFSLLNSYRNIELMKRGSVWVEIRRNAVE